MLPPTRESASTALWRTAARSFWTCWTWSKSKKKMMGRLSFQQLKLSSWIERVASQTNWLRRSQIPFYFPALSYQSSRNRKKNSSYEDGQATPSHAFAQSLDSFGKLSPVDVLDLPGNSVLRLRLEVAKDLGC